MKTTQSARLGSLDILRGFDLFVLVFFQPVFMTLVRNTDISWLDAMATQFTHVQWEGFRFWDIIMPLFMFMAGASMPFAFQKYLSNGSKARLYRRIIKRVILLFIFGMMCQGNLLALNPDRIYFYSNTLQAIAVGYLISAVLLMHFNLKWQIILTSGLLITYWALLTFVRVDGFGGGNFTPDHNLAEYVDRLVLGRFRDQAKVTPDGLDFGNYRYTWILSSLNFGVTVMTGVFAGQIIKSKMTKRDIIKWLVIAGVAMVVAGHLWSFQMPIIKKIWTSSMTLLSSGYCFLLMALFYFLIDYHHYGKYLNWLKIYGMNSIMAYMLYMIVNFSSVTRSLFFGTEQYLGDFYPVLIRLGNVSIVFFILWVMYKQRIFLKV
ncbi:MAG: acyltransferase family protein [Tangfeifania sp.]